MHYTARLILNTAFIVAGLLMTGMASAQGFYIGASAGQSKSKLTGVFDAGTFSTATYGVPGLFTRSQDDSDTAYKLNLGYQFNKHFAIETSYVNSGKFNVRYTGVGAAAGDSESLDYKVDAWTVAGVGILPVTDQFSVFGKLGVAASRVKTNDVINIVSQGDVGSSAENKTRTTALYGVGVKYDVSKNIAVRGEYEYFGNVYKVGFDGFSGSIKQSLISVGLDYRF